MVARFPCQMAIDSGDRSGGRLESGMQRLRQRGEALAQLERIPEARAFASSASRSGGVGTRPRAVLTKSSQMASPRKVNSAV
jgi:hypothetical protein